MMEPVVENPPSFHVKTECEKAAFDNGFRIRDGWGDEGWGKFRSSTAKGAIWLAGGSMHGPWFLAVERPDIVDELGLPPVDMPGPGEQRYAFDTLDDLYRAIRRVYQLGASLPTAPLEEFRRRTRGLPVRTEAERLVIQRIGQDIFRQRLLEYWQGRCVLTGIATPELLRASHIRPWAQCETDEQRLDVHNGLLLSALWDAAFDAGLVTFDDEGVPVFSNRLPEKERMLFTWRAPLPLRNAHRHYLAWHRTHVFLQ